ncbi:hypothetical protein GGR56DRAFT_464784 [Xylariaceae sp. FL0804]|nr:hypothetical protein GGR56DRAFT_464784 [Xylariaceae sp. FL0804]
MRHLSGSRTTYRRADPFAPFLSVCPTKYLLPKPSGLQHRFAVRGTWPCPFCPHLMSGPSGRYRGDIQLPARWMTYLMIRVQVYSVYEGSNPSPAAPAPVPVPAPVPAAASAPVAPAPPAPPLAPPPPPPAGAGRRYHFGVTSRGNEASRVWKQLHRVGWSRAR